MRIRPFRGYRFAAGRVGDLSRVMAPPYDQIDAEAQAALCARSPYNVVRLTLNPDGHAAARAALTEWLAAGVLEREATPAIYPYHQSYTVDGRPVTRKGFIALGEVTDYGERVVLPHERTHAGPREDRLRHLEATAADIQLLFMLTSDPIGALLDATEPEGAPLIDVRDRQGERHRLWRIADADRIGRAQALVAERTVIIADGHHRYEPAVAYRRQHPEAADKMMAFFALEAPGLTIFPNHRLISDVEGFELPRFLEAARPWFDVAPLADPVAFTPKNRSLGLVAGRDAAVLAVREEAFERIAWPAGTSPAWRQLAVAILHEGLLRPLLGITDEKLDAKTHVDYTADLGEAVRLAREGRYQAAFLIAPTTPEELRAVVAGGEILPQKSTHFYPKLLDGLVVHRYGNRL